MSWFADLKLSKKLAIGTVLKVFPFLCVCLYLASALSQTGRQTDLLFGRDLALISAARDLRLGLIHVGRSIRMQHLAPKDERGVYDGLIEAQRAKMKASIESIGKIELTDSQRRELETFRSKVDAWFVSIERAMAANHADKLADALVAIGESKKVAEELEPVVNRLIESANERAFAQHEAVAKAVEQGQAGLLLGALVSVLISIVVVWRVTEVVIPPIHEMREKLALVGEGDFTQRIESHSKDEVGQVAVALNATLDKVAKALLDVRTVARQLTGSAGELHSSATDISGGASEQASGFEETAASLEEITSTVKSTSENAQQATRLAADSRGAAESGQQVVESAISAMTDLSKSSRQIADIITTIDEIAFQTNLLALNAAVEAARAGEQGRGFAVVANEVRNLAQRSATSAREIKALIQGSLAKVDAGVQLVNQSGEALRGIVNAVKSVSGLMGEIASAAKEQSIGVEQVNKAVLQMDQITQRNAGQTEELTATADRLTASAKHLEQTVARFKLSGEGGIDAVMPAMKPAPKKPVSGGRPATAQGAGFRPLPPAPFPSEMTPPEGFQEF